MPAIPADRTIGIVGAGAMGAGIAQVAATAGHRVRLYDVRPGAVETAIANLGRTLETLVAKGKMGADKAEIEGIQVVRRPGDILHRADAGRRAIDRHTPADGILQHSA